MKKLIATIIMIMTLATMFVGCGKEEEATLMEEMIYNGVIAEYVNRAETMIEEITRTESVEEETFNEFANRVETMIKEFTDKETIEEETIEEETIEEETAWVSPEYLVELDYNTRENDW